MERLAFVFLIGAFTLAAALVQDFAQILKADLVGDLHSLAEHSLVVLGALFTAIGEIYDRRECGTEYQILAKHARAFGIILLCTSLPGPWFVLTILPLAFALGSRMQVKLQKRELKYQKHIPYWPRLSLAFALISAAAVLRGVSHLSATGRVDAMLGVGILSGLLAVAFAVRLRR